MPWRCQFVTDISVLIFVWYLLLYLFPFRFVCFNLFQTTIVYKIQSVLNDYMYCLTFIPFDSLTIWICLIIRYFEIVHLITNIVKFSFVVLFEPKLIDKLCLHNLDFLNTQMLSMLTKCLASHLNSHSKQNVSIKITTLQSLLFVVNVIMYVAFL